MKGGKSESRAKQTDSKLSVKRAAKNPKSRANAKWEPRAKQTHSKVWVEKAVIRDPNKPKMPEGPTSPYPCSAFMLFTLEFDRQFKEKHKNKTFAAIKAAAGVVWETMSDADKAPYLEDVEKSTIEYEKSFKEYKKRVEEYDKCMNEYDRRMAAYKTKLQAGGSDKEGREEVLINLSRLII